ncbi:MAG: ATP-dependent DNA helicase RecG [Clostridia bacterium]|nr:ATP-dependent DNA helicase RecG [Clostridia bacterium]
MSDFCTDIRYLKGVGKVRAEYLNNMGIDTVGALLRFYPRDYEDFGKLSKLTDCFSGDTVCIKGKIITDISEHYIRKNMTVFKFRIYDGSFFCGITIFNNKYLAAKLKRDSEYLFLGKLEADKFGFSMSSPQIRETNYEGIIPVYRASANITSATLEKLVREAIRTTETEEVLLESIRRGYNLTTLRDAIENIHFPKSREALVRAKRYLVFEELFVLATSLMLLKGKRKQAAKAIINHDYTDEFYASLKFTPTAAQRRAVKECIRDMASGRVMNRLIEGDVGSGKTLVAAALMYNAARCGYQSVIMAPTEILAEQHFKSINEFLEGTDIECVLLTGSMKKSEKTAAKQKLLSGEAAVAIGTHALLSDDVEFKNAALVITDEQHRFGVNQRARLALKGENAHTLVMSATPIPRTLGLIIYGDLDISILDEYPRGRAKTESYVVSSELRERVFNFIKKHLDEGRQGYIVCPMVDESEQTEGIKSAQQYYFEIKDGAFKDYKVGLLHGKMKAAEKDAVMRAFKNNEIDLLVCTTVIEVGIDVPNAAIMVIENAERFGLSTLHQLRGRIGRGKYNSSCVFITDVERGDTAERMAAVKNTSDGFKIAEADLKLRGPGDFLGSRQHGLPDLKIADLYADNDILKLASMAAANLLEHDPKLKNPDNLCLRKAVIDMYKRLNEN